MYCYVWEYRVRSDETDAFQKQYGPEGAWVALFARAPGYVGTRLLRDRADSDRFLTIDTWETAADHSAFREQFTREFEELDRRCEALTVSEIHLGDFETHHGPIRENTHRGGQERNDGSSSEADKRAMLRHFLAALAYRTQKALRGAPEDFADFEAGNLTRTPKELVRHMTSVLGYARTFFRGGRYRPARLPTMRDEVHRFHEILEDLSDHLASADPLTELTSEQLLQGPFSDAMTHAGQLAMLRRLHGSPVPPENFIFADVDPANVGADQAAPQRPDAEWRERL